MPLPARVTTLTVAFLAVAGGVIFVVAHYLLGGPPTVDFAAALAKADPNAPAEAAPPTDDTGDSE